MSNYVPASGPKERVEAVLQFAACLGNLDGDLDLFASNNLSVLAGTVVHARFRTALRTAFAAGARRRRLLVGGQSAMFGAAFARHSHGTTVAAADGGLLARVGAAGRLVGVHLFA